ncbi:MAG: hypothetical protein BSR46_02760 [Candidatus Dactylopiibacterium carminicum]|nr:MAG: hypothetical protein BSR46_02760 [Candidatus Dactylopiibacterium carminicum]
MLPSTIRGGANHRVAITGVFSTAEEHGQHRAAGNQDHRQHAHEVGQYADQTDDQQRYGMAGEGCEQISDAELAGTALAISGEQQASHQEDVQYAAKQVQQWNQRHHHHHQPTPDQGEADPGTRLLLEEIPAAAYPDRTLARFHGTSAWQGNVAILRTLGKIQRRFGRGVRVGGHDLFHADR